MVDLECTYWPDVWFGISLTDCCVRHDLSSLSIEDSINLGVCAFRALAPVSMPVAVVIGSVMALATAIWCGIQYGPRGKRDR